MSVKSTIVLALTMHLAVFEFEVGFAALSPIGDGGLGIAVINWKLPVGAEEGIGE